MSPSLRIAALTLAACCTGSALAADLEVTAPWVRATVAAQKVTGAFMQLSSQSGVTVVGVASPAARIVEIHEMLMDRQVMKMRALPRLEVPAGQSVELKPGSYHVMLIDLKRPLVRGDSVPITLKVEGRDKKVETVTVAAEVRDLGAAPAMVHEHEHHR